MAAQHATLESKIGRGQARVSISSVDNYGQALPGASETIQGILLGAELPDLNGEATGAMGMYTITVGAHELGVCGQISAVRRANVRSGGARRRRAVVRSNGDDPLAGSFEARMRLRRTEREQRTTEMFEPPGFEDLFRVEMQVLGYRQLADLSLKHQRQRDDAMRSLYLAADQVLAATVAFHLIQDDGTLDEIEDASWSAIARKMYPSEGTTRRASR